MQPAIQIESSSGLLHNLKRTVEVWFYKVDPCSLSQVVDSILRILLNGLRVTPTSNTYHEFFNDLFWLNTSASFFGENSMPSVDEKQDDDKKFTEILTSWVAFQLRESSLCSTLQMLILDKELMDYYDENAFLKDENNSNACFLCISALQLRNPALLSLISRSVYVPINDSKLTHRRSSSHPHYSMSPNLIGNKDFEANINLRFALRTEELAAPVTETDGNINEKIKTSNISILRKHKSLQSITESFRQRSRSQTLSQPMSIPNQEFFLSKSRRSFDSSPIMSFVDETQLSELHSNRQLYGASSSSAGTNIETDNAFCKGAIKKVATPENKPLCKRLSVQKQRNSKALKFDKNCLNNDDIKIHVDQSCENSLKVESTNSNTTKSPSLPSLSFKGISSSPINFFSWKSNIFSPRSDPISIRSDELSTKSCSSSLAGSFSKSLTSDVLGPFVGPRDGQKLLKVHSNAFDELMSNYNSPIHSDSDTNTTCTIANNQNLASLLKTNLFSSNHTDLERENAHFKISEAVISVIEHIKWTKAEIEMNKSVNKNEKLTQKSEPKSTLDNIKIENSFKDNELVEIIETATSYLDSKEESSAPSTAESANEEKDYEYLLDAYDNILPEHVAYAEWGCSFNAYSAENLGLSLISKFNDSDLPRVSELKWLVSEEICTRYNVPQDLLPIPDINASENPDDHVEHQIQRGTRYWAPPRKQIIFTDHNPLTRKEQMQKQSYRCAGCGMRVAPIYSNRFRYCHYLGKYHCTGCHRNHKSIIPAKVLKKWDFGLYPVSLFSYRLLEEIWQYPLFQLPDIAPTLYQRVRSLGTAKQNRLQLQYLKDFITTCRFSQNEEKLFYEIQTYITVDPDKWSMSDFIDTKEGTLQSNLKIIIEKCRKHVSNCVLCTARGFICEVCCNDDPIFPWQEKVKRCDKCGNCYHFKCFKGLKNEHCLKCLRLAKKTFREKSKRKI